MLNTTQFWQAKPFPHIVIDNWLPPNQYARMSKELNEINDTPYATFSSRIEAGKATFEKDSRLGQCLAPVVHNLTHEDWLEELESLLGVPELFPLTHYSQQSDYKYFHQMHDGGILGSHVDHSQFYGKDGKVDSKVHVLNCLYYATEDYGIGGDTLLFDPMGFKVQKVIPYQPNRLVVFLHSSNSWHGVNRLHWREPRTSVYMDYYCKREQLAEINKEAYLQNAEPLDFKPFKWWRHKTTFVPRDWRMHRYLPCYIQWLAKRKLIQ